MKNNQRGTKMMIKTFAHALISAFVVICVLPQNVLLQMCTLTNTTLLTCNDIVPMGVPVNVTHVHINTISHDLDFSDLTFSNRSWQTVTSLDITAWYNSGHGRVTFEGSPFTNLHALKHLGFRGDEINNFGPNNFDKLKHLDELQFSQCPNLDMESVINALKDTNITTDTLFLNDVGSETGRKFTMNQKFFNFVEKIKVKSLIIRYTIIHFELIPYGQRKPQNLKALHISQVSLLIPYNMKTIHDLYEAYAFFLQGIQTLNISSMPAQFVAPNKEILNNRVITDCDVLGRFVQLILRVESLILNDLYKLPFIINNTLFDLSNCHFNIKKLHFQANNVQYLNMSFYLPPSNTLMEVDLSNNRIRYASRSVFLSMPSLEILRMNSNELFHMENSPDFNELLVSLTALRHFSVTKNKLTNIPREMFRHNLALETIDFKDNRLKTIMFQLIHLRSLNHLNIAQNSIKYLDGNALAEIKSFFKLNASTGGNHDDVVIELTKNPFECSCDSVNFMEWIFSVDRHQVRKYTCLMEGKLKEINEESISCAKFLCYRTITIACVSVFVILMIVGIVTLVVLIRERRKKQLLKCERNHFLHKFQNGLLKEQYLCQISYSSEDEHCLLNTIIPNLERIFKQKLDTDQDVICTGDKNFCLGRPIIDEVFRCISESCVIVCIISKSFCDSRWCEMELKEAYETGKPIILILKEQVETEVMSPLLNTIFNRYTRAKLVEAEGQFKLTPDWDNLAESIISLADENCRVKQAVV